VVTYLQETFFIAQRRACRLVQQPRSTQRRRSSPRSQEQRLVRRMLLLVRRHPRYGYRRIWVLLRREGWRINRKRVYRLWRQESLKVPRKRRKKRYLGMGSNGCACRRALYPNHVWAWDFIHDRTSDGRALKWLIVVDEYTRECLLLEARRQLPATGVGRLLENVLHQRGVPEHIRSDNGPEFIAQAIRQWLKHVGVETLYIEPGCPWQNGYAESFVSRLRDELLATEEFNSELEAQVVSQEWKRAYNHERPHSALGYRTPVEFAGMGGWPTSATLRRASHPCVTIDPTLIAPGT
jgi:transposase InsO family protein